MARKTVEDIINEIEIFVDSCKYVAFSQNKVSVPRDELHGMLEEVKMKMPAEIERCKKIMRNKDAIMQDAKNRAEAKIEEAQLAADRLVEESNIVKNAQKRAEEIIAAANAEADEIVMMAEQDAKDMRLAAMEYTQSQLDSIMLFLNKTLEAERANYQNLITSLENDAEILQANSDEMANQISATKNTPIQKPVAVDAQGFPQFDDGFDDFPAQNNEQSETAEDDDDFEFDDDDMDY